MQNLKLSKLLTLVVGALMAMGVSSASFADAQQASPQASTENASASVSAADQQQGQASNSVAENEAEEIEQKADAETQDDKKE
jgi:hypothetical protein